MSGCCCNRNKHEYVARESYRSECDDYGGIYLGDYTWRDCSEYLCMRSLSYNVETVDSWPFVEVVLISGLALFLLIMLH